MIKVNDVIDRADLNVLLKTAESIGNIGVWQVQNLEYCGLPFNRKYPIDIERESRLGLVLSHSEFQNFVSSVTQVNEGVFVLSSARGTGGSGQDIIFAEIYDSGFWRIGGQAVEKILENSSLMVIE